MIDALLDGLEISALDAHTIAFQIDGDVGSQREQIERAEPRTETNMIATIRLKDGTELPCVVKDVSKSGAKLGIPRDCVLPESFMFKMNGRDFIFLVKLAWRRDRYAGVRIERVAKLPPTLGRG